MSREDHEYKVESQIPDLYDILGLTIDVCNQADCDEQIKKSYRKKSVLCHPDKHPGRKDMKEVFMLITEAYNILIDPEQRRDYNNKLSLDKQSSSDFYKLRGESTKYLETVGAYKPATDEMKLSFKERMKIMDSKHGYNSSMEGPLGKNEAKNLLNNRTSERDAQYEALKPEMIFDHGRFDAGKFNAAWDELHANGGTDGLLIPHTGAPSAWNDGDTDYSTIGNMESLYVDEDGQNIESRKGGFASIDRIGMISTKKIGKEEVSNMKAPSYVNGHADIEDDYYKNIRVGLSKRGEESTTYDKMGYSDYKKNDFGGYGIFDKIGNDIGPGNRLGFEDSEDLNSRFERMKMDRQMNRLDTAKKPITGRR